MTTLIHVTHEAPEKMGGIGAVLEGLLTARAYQSLVDRTVLVGTTTLPFDEPPADLETVWYETGLPAMGGVGSASVGALQDVERRFGVRLLYGRRMVSGPLETRRAPVEVLLLDVRDALAEPVNRLKGELYHAFGLASDRYERDWGYEEWVRVAGPGLEALEALLGAELEQAVLVSHEFMGLPTLLAARARGPLPRTVYWAHEVPPVRDLLERRRDHRLIFHQAARTREGRRSYEALLCARGGYKHALVSLAWRLDRVFAVSDSVARELRVLSPEFHRVPVDVVYNGLPARPIDLEARLRSRALLRRYAEALVGTETDFVFTHVARPVASKAFERDMAVLEHLDDLLAERGQTAVLLILATDAGRRSADLVRGMEARYGWPVHHRRGWPDLVKGEVPIGLAAEAYNQWARATRVVLVNQFGFDRASCGDRTPESMTFQDLRQGADAEFGQSAYEPFGIAQLETLAFGGLSVISGVCGCAQLLKRACGGRMPPNVLVARYAAGRGASAECLDEAEHDRIEHQVAARLTRDLLERLPSDRDELARLLESGWAAAERMSWQAVCAEYFAPALERLLGRPVRRRTGSAAVEFADDARRP